MCTFIKRFQHVFNCFSIIIIKKKLLHKVFYETAHDSAAYINTDMRQHAHALFTQRGSARMRCDILSKMEVSHSRLDEEKNC